MAIMKFGDDRGLQNAHGDTIALQHTLGGEPYGSIGNAVGDNARWAVESTAPYRPDGVHAPREPKEEKSIRSKRPTARGGWYCAANNDTCNGYARKDTGYCFGHSMSLGKIDASNSRQD